MHINDDGHRGRGAAFDAGSNINVVRSNVALFHAFLEAYEAAVLPSKRHFDWVPMVVAHLGVASEKVGRGDQRADSAGRVAELTKRTGLSLFWSVMVLAPAAVDGQVKVQDALLGCLRRRASARRLCGVARAAPWRHRHPPLIRGHRQ